MKVGISNNKYPEQRTIIINKNVEYVNCQKKNFFFFINAVNTKIFKNNKRFLFKPIGRLQQKDVDVFHVFNEVALTDQKWVATFETELPRILPPKSGNKSDNYPELDKLSSALTAGNCLALIALSDAAFQMENRLFQRRLALATEILAKTVIIHPPQELHLSQRDKRSDAKPVHFAFVGMDFYRKGGGEIVRAFSELIEESLLTPDQVKVTLIGDLEKKHNYALGAYQDDDAFYTHTEAVIAGHSLFEHAKHLPNAQVLELFKQADVGLLPTWAETYGYSVLEMQSCGCPVITSNVRALPEINPDNVGWQVSNPLDQDRDFAIKSVQQRDAFRLQTIQQLKATILSIVNAPEQIHPKANASIERIRKEHDLSVCQEKLLAIYRR